MEKKTFFELLIMSDFWSLLHAKKKWKELFDISSYEVYLSVICSFLFTFILSRIFLKDINSFTNILSNISLALGTGFLGMLGFIIAGLAMTSSILTKETMKKIESDELAEEIVDILFSFQFIGFIVANLSIIYFGLYMISYVKDIIPIFFFYLLSLIICYLTTFSIFYGIELLGTCIKMFLMNYEYNKE